jgi:outer membrane lipoprotein carrier protein
MRFAMTAATLLLFCICAVSSTRAADPPALTAIELAKRIDSRYNRLQSLKADFTEQYSGLGMHRSESGTMLLRKPGRMRWNYTSTQGKVFVLDAKYAWFYTPGVPQVQRIKASELDDLRSPLRFLLGHTKIESELDRLTLVPRIEIQGSVQTRDLILTGVPKGQQKRIAKVSIAAAESGAIKSLEIDETDGAQTVFYFSNEQTNPVLPDSEFHFTPPAGIPVVDAPPPV